MAEVKSRTVSRVWASVIFAVFLREIKSKSKDKLGVAWSVISPVAFILILSFIRGRVDGGYTYGIPTFFFMVFGILQVQFFLGLVGSVSGSIQKNRPLYAFRQVQPMASVLAVAGFELVVQFFVIIAISIISYFLGFEGRVEFVLHVIYLFTLVWLFATSLGLLFSVAKAFVPEVDRVRSLAMRPVFFISGIFFSLRDIPEIYWPYLTWNPLLHAVELTRYAAYPMYGHLGVSYSYLNMSVLLTVFLALAVYHVGWKQAISR